MRQNKNICTAKRIVLAKQPFAPKSILISHHASAPWPAKWVGYPDDHCDSPEVLAFHLRCEVRRNMTVRVHVSADERYELFLDGARIGRGPERGDPGNWNYESYRLNLSKGTHHLAAKVWWFKAGNLSPYAQMSVRPAFLLAAEGVSGKMLSTSSAPWKVMRIEGIELLPPEFAWGTGAKTRQVAEKFPWGFEKGVGTGWVPASAVADAGFHGEMCFQGRSARETSSSDNVFRVFRPFLCQVYRLPRLYIIRVSKMEYETAVSRKTDTWHFLSIKTKPNKRLTNICLPNMDSSIERRISQGFVLRSDGNPLFHGQNQV